MDYRDKLKNICNSTGRAEDIANFKETRNQVSHIIKRAQKAHLTKTIDNNLSNSKKFFDQSPYLQLFN